MHNNTVTHFRKELLPPPRTFYQREFGSTLGREHRGWAQTKCCFHDGQSKTSLSLNLSEGGFYCFSCGAKGGDVVAFLRLRYKLDFKSACAQLGAWQDDISPEETKRLRRLHQERERELADREAKRQTEKRERIEARRKLHMLEGIYSDASKGLSKLRSGVEANPDEEETCWAIMEDALPEIRAAEARYLHLAGLRCWA